MKNRADGQHAASEPPLIRSIGSAIEHTSDDARAEEVAEIVDWSRFVSCGGTRGIPAQASHAVNHLDQVVAHPVKGIATPWFGRSRLGG